MLKPKYNLTGIYIYSSCPGGKFVPLAPVSYATDYDILYLHSLQ